MSGFTTLRFLLKSYRCGKAAQADFECEKEEEAETVPEETAGYETSWLWARHEDKEVPTTNNPSSVAHESCFFLIFLHQV